MARSFNGTNQALQAASVDLSGTSAVSVSCWFRCTEYSATTEFILEFTNDSDSSSQGWGFYTDNNTLIKLVHLGNVGYNGCDYTGPTPADQWRHYVAIFDKTQTGPANEVDLYINGTIQSGTRTVNDNTNDFIVSTLNFASRGAASLWRNCSLAEVGVWNIRLSAGNITSLAGTAGVANSAALPSSVAASNLKGYWALLGTTSPEPDTSGAGHNAALTGTPAQVTHPVEPTYAVITLMGAACM